MMTTKDYLVKLLRESGKTPKSLKPRQIIEESKELFFDFDFPLWTDNEKYRDLYGDFRPQFETMFLKHFWRYKIGFSDEELDDFNLAVDEALNLVMPYYNRLLESETWFDKYIDNPANNTDYKETYTRIIDTTNESSVATSSSAETETGQETNSEGSQVDSGKSKSLVVSSSEDTSNSETVQHGETGTKTKDSTNDLPKIEQGEDFDFTYASNQSLSDAKAISDQITTTEAETGSEQESESKTESINESKTNEKGELSATSLTSGESESATEESGNTVEEYEFRRQGNIGVQTPGEVFEHTRKAFINTMDQIFKDPEIKALFLQVY